MRPSQQLPGGSRHSPLTSGTISGILAVYQTILSPTYLTNYIPPYLIYLSYLPNYLTTLLPYPPCIYRYDRLDHWITETDLNKHGKRTTRNCQICLEIGKRYAKAMNMCPKCNVPLHSRCFKPYTSAPRPTSIIALWPFY